MLDTNTKKRIDDCRDILVGKLPDPKAQIEQITIALIYKFMDDMDKEAIELGGAAKFFSGNYQKYSWDALFDTKVTANEMLTLYSDAIASMDKNPNIPQLFRDIFKNAFLPYRDPETLKLFLKTIGEFEYTHSEKLGDAFEYLLSVMGSQGDAGQFRTPRHIIDFLVAVVDPQKTDTILDPACGTAGFLISAFKYIMGGGRDGRPSVSTRLTPDERRRIISNFTGYDISPDMVRLSLVNLYLHGFSDPHIWEYDTLSSEDRWNETYDVILANPPFMSPKGGIRPHKKFSISSNRSEVLFVDYIAEHLNPKGRAGIIVPEGVIFQSGTAYKDLRKMLVENYLYAVVSLPAGVFNPYSGVKTSILLMDKELAKASDEILFVKIDNDGYGLGAQRNAVKGSQLDEAIEVIRAFAEPHGRAAQQFHGRASQQPNLQTAIAHTVPKAEIAKNGDYNLSGERYKVTYENSTIWNTVPLNEIVEYTQLGLVKGKTEQGEKSVEFPHPYIKMDSINWSGQLDLSNVSYVNATEEEVKKLTLDDGDFVYNTRNAPNLVGKCSVFHGKSGVYLFNNNILRIKFDGSKANPDFINRILTSDKGKKQVQSLIAGTTSVAAIYQKEYLSIQIPLPPLSVQEEIVAEIESYQKIINGAKMVVESYKPKIDIDPDWEMVELGEVFSKVNDNVFPEELTVKVVNYIGLENISQGSGFLIGNFETNPKEIKSTKIVFQKGDILYGKLRPNLNKVYFSEIEGICSTDIFVIRGKDGIAPKFYSYLLLSEHFNQEVLKGIKGAQLPRVGYESFSQISIPYPPLETQRQIVSRIEKEQELVNANKQLIEIFEQKIKNRIAKVWGEETHGRASQNAANEQELNIAAEPTVDYMTNQP